MKPRSAEAIRQDRFGASLARVAMPRRARRGREQRSKPEPAADRFAGSARHASAPDPVQIAVLAMQILGPASMRASCTGTEVRVSAPDEAMAAIFRAALAETGRNRATDRLIRVVIG